MLFVHQTVRSVSVVLTYHLSATFPHASAVNPQLCNLQGQHIIGLKLVHYCLQQSTIYFCRLGIPFSYLQFCFQLVCGFLFHKFTGKRYMQLRILTTIATNSWACGTYVILIHYHRENKKNCLVSTFYYVFMFCVRQNCFYFSYIE